MWKCMIITVYKLNIDMTYKIREQIHVGVTSYSITTWLYFCSSLAHLWVCKPGNGGSLGCTGKQHHNMKAMNATNVPTRRIKSSIV